MQVRRRREFNRKGREERKEKKGGNKMDKREDSLSNAIIGAAIEVHKQLGPGLLESAYEVCLAHEFTLRQIPFERQKPLPVIYKSVNLDVGYRLDLLVDGLVVVELKVVESFAPIHEAQMITYLKLTNCKLGLLLNFNVRLMKNGIKRVALNL
jgi:GxxExxY protein